MKYWNCSPEAKYQYFYRINTRMNPLDLVARDRYLSVSIPYSYYLSWCCICKNVVWLWPTGKHYRPITTHLILPQNKDNGSNKLNCIGSAQGTYSCVRSNGNYTFFTKPKAFPVWYVRLFFNHITPLRKYNKIYMICVFGYDKTIIFVNCF